MLITSSPSCQGGQMRFTTLPVAKKARVRDIQPGPDHFPSFRDRERLPIHNARIEEIAPLS